MRESRIGVGVVGVGGISRQVHLPGLTLAPQAEIVALCDANETALAQVAAEYNVAKTPKAVATAYARSYAPEVRRAVYRGCKAAFAKG